MGICNTVAGSRRLEAVCHIKGAFSATVVLVVGAFFSAAY